MNFKHIEEQIAKLHDANYILVGGGIIKLSPKDVADTLQQLLDVARAAEKSDRELQSWINGIAGDSRRIIIHNCHSYLSDALDKLEEHGP